MNDGREWPSGDKMEKVCGDQSRVVCGTVDKKDGEMNSVGEGDGQDSAGINVSDAPVITSRRDGGFNSIDDGDVTLRGAQDVETDRLSESYSDAAGGRGADSGSTSAGADGGVVPLSTGWLIDEPAQLLRLYGPADRPRRRCCPTSVYGGSPPRT